MGWIRGDRFVYILTAVPSIVIGLIIFVAIVTGNGSGGAHAFTVPTPAPVGP
jgi:ABC-type phosphate transport system permease subunit